MARERGYMNTSFHGDNAGFLYNGARHRGIPFDYAAAYEYMRKNATDPKGPRGAAGQLAARVPDRDGPFAVDARLTVSRDRSFLLDGTLMPRGPVAPALERSLQLLGPADASGRRPFSVSGTF